MPDDVILQWGHPGLRARAVAVEQIDDLLRAQGRRLASKLEQVNGAGLRWPAHARPRCPR